MVDNVQITAGTGTTVAADDIAGVLHQRVKLSIGADGSASDAIGNKGNATDSTQRVVVADDDTNLSRITSSTIGGVAPTSIGKATTTFAFGGQYNATPPTFADGNQGIIQLDANGRVNATLQSVGPVAPGTAASKSNLTGGVYNSSAPTLTNGQQAALQLDSAGRLQTAVATALPAGSNAIGSVTLGAGANAIGSVTIGSALPAGSNAIGTVSLNAALPTGTNSIGAVTNTHLTNALIGEYETVAASQTAQVLGATGATGDYLASLLIVPATTSPGNVVILDNATSITVFTGGASSVSNLVPFVIPLGMTSVSGAWKVTTGANVSVIAIGNFT